MNSRSFYWLCLFCLLGQTGFPQQTPLSALPTFVEHKVDSVFSDWHLPNTPGGAIAVIHKGKVVLKKGYGMADVGKKSPMTTASLINIASTAKQFTATCIALLEEQGKLSFDDDIRKYFPQFQIKKPVTIRHLISHTSGLREAYVLAALSGKVNLKGQVRKRYKTTDHLIRLMAKQQDLNFDPGHEFAYTNINYILLGEIVRQVSGLRLAEFAHQSIFKPLGMVNSYYNDPRAMSRAGRAIPYTQDAKNKRKFKRHSIRNDQGVVGDNNLITCLDDLILWNQNFQKNRLGLGRESLLKTLQTRYILTNGDTIHYAFGLNVTPYKNTLSVGHGGDDSRYTSLMMRFPNQQLDLICLSNRSDYGDTEQKVFAVADLLLKTSASPAKPVSKPALAIIPFDALLLKPHIGQYMGSSPKNRYSFREIFVQNGKPYVSFLPRPTKHVFELLPMGNNHYLFKVGEPDVYIETWFSQSKAGGQDHSFERPQNNDTLRFDRTATDPASTGPLTPYAGSYTSHELDSQLQVKVNKSGLSFTRGIIKIKTIPMGKDTFYAPENRALFYFKRDETGVVNEFLIEATDFRQVKYSR